MHEFSPDDQWARGNGELDYLEKCRKKVLFSTKLVQFFCHRMKRYLHCTKKTRSCVAKLVYYSIEAVGCTMVCNQNPKTMVGCSIQNLQTTYYVVVDGHLRVPLRWLSVLFAFAPLRVSPFLFVVSKSNKPKKNESD